MDKMAIARRKCARGAVLTLLFGNPRAAVMQRTLEYALMQDDPQAANEIGSHIYYLADKGYVKCYLGDEVLSLVQDPPREALVRLTAKNHCWKYQMSVFHTTVFPGKPESFHIYPFHYFQENFSQL